MRSLVNFAKTELQHGNTQSGIHSVSNNTLRQTLRLLGLRNLASFSRASRNSLRLAAPILRVRKLWRNRTVKVSKASLCTLMRGVNNREGKHLEVYSKYGEPLYKLRIVEFRANNEQVYDTYLFDMIPFNHVSKRFQARAFDAMIKVSSKRNDYAQCSINFNERDLVRLSSGTSTYNRLNSSHDHPYKLLKLVLRYGNHDSKHPSRITVNERSLANPTYTINTHNAMYQTYEVHKGRIKNDDAYKKFFRQGGVR